MQMVKEMFAICGCIAAVLLTVGVVLVLPMAYFDGSAKANWIKQRHGIDVPWYHAANLHVEVGDTKTTVSGELTLNQANDAE